MPELTYYEKVSRVPNKIDGKFKILKIFIERHRNGVILSAQY